MFLVAWTHTRRGKELTVIPRLGLRHRKDGVVTDFQGNDDYG